MIALRFGERWVCQACGAWSASDWEVWGALGAGARPARPRAAGGRGVARGRRDGAVPGGGGMIRRLVFTIRKTLWYFLVIGAPTNPCTHWRKWGELERWLREQE